MIEAGGGVLSPFEPRHPAFPGQFLQRNGIVAALADAVVIVEAAGRSGALNTASWAADLGLPVLAFPGDVDRPKVAGCLALIRDGATLVRSPGDILADLGLAAPDVTLPKPPAPPADPLQAELLRALGAGEAPLDDLLAATGGRTAEVLGALTLLEVAGRVERRPGQRYAAAHLGEPPLRAADRPLVRYRLICVGRVREAYVAAAVDDFERRLRRIDPLEIVEVAASHGADPARAMREEAEAALKRIDPGDVVWLLERTGRAFSSVELSERLHALQVEGVSRLVLVIAGTYGAGEALAARANLQWSLSPLTLLHEWVRAIVLEQLYRAAKIARNEPYHH